MSQFNSNHLDHLIKFCCWIIKVEPNKNGFDTLAGKINDHIGKHSLISVKYLQNLWTDIRTGVSTGQLITKQEDYLLELIQFCGYLSWIEFEEEIDRIESYIREYPSLSTFEEISVLVLTTDEEVHQIMPMLSFHRKILDVRVEIKQSAFEDLCDLKDSLSNHAYVASYISPKSSESGIHPIESEKWNELISTNRFVPIWVGNERANVIIDGVSRHQIIIGQRGLVLSLLVLNGAKDKAKNSRESSISSKKSTPSQKIKHFKGIIANGDLNMTGGNLSLGDTNYYSENRKENGNNNKK